jgi:hypothetical protein
MTEKTLYFVQPYVVRRHKLAASGALTFTDRAEAMAAGADLARRRAGIVVLAQSYDGARQALMTPQVLRIHGKVPVEWTAQRLAA